MLVGFIIGFFYVLFGAIVLSGKYRNGISLHNFFKLSTSFLLWPIFYSVAIISGIDPEDFTEED